MKKVLVVILLSLALLLVATPLLADKPAPTGGQINVLGGTPDMYPAGAPFFVGHGWLFYPNEYPPGLFDFQLPGS